MFRVSSQGLCTIGMNECKPTGGNQSWSLIVINSGWEELQGTQYTFGELWPRERSIHMLTLILLDVWFDYVGWNGCQFMNVVEINYWGWVLMYETTKTNQNEFFRGWILKCSHFIGTTLSIFGLQIDPKLLINARTLASQIWWYPFFRLGTNTRP
jgi:hypothetical protein